MVHWRLKLSLCVCLIIDCLKTNIPYYGHYCVVALVTTSFILRNIFCLATLNIVGCLLLHFCYIKHASANVHCYICRTSILFPVWPSPLHGRVWHWKGPPPLGSLFATGGRQSCLWSILAWFDKSLTGPGFGQHSGPANHTMVAKMLPMPLSRNMQCLNSCLYVSRFQYSCATSSFSVINSCSGGLSLAVFSDCIVPIIVTLLVSHWASWRQEAV